MNHHTPTSEFKGPAKTPEAIFRDAAADYTRQAKLIPGSSGEYGDALIGLDVATFELRGRDLSEVARKIVRAVNTANFASARVDPAHLLALLLDACDDVPPAAHAVMAAAARAMMGIDEAGS